MKILMLSTCILPSTEWKYTTDYGGLEKICASVASGLAALGHEVTMIACEGSQADGVKIIALPRGAPEEAMIAQYKDIMADVDIVEDHSWLKWAAFLFSQESEKYKKAKIQLFHHGFLGPSTPAPLEKPCWTGFSRKHAQHMSMNLGQPVKYVWHGISPDLYPLETEKGDYYLILNRLSPEKGVHEAVRMLKQAKKKVVIAGDTRIIADQGYAKRVLDECDGMMVKMMPNVTQEQKVKLLQKAKAIVHTPLYPWIEAFGLTISEAMSVGTPVLALDNGGVTDQVKHGKTGFVAQDMEELSTYIDKVDKIKPEDCRQRVLDFFTTEKMVMRHLNLIEQIVAGGGW